VVTLAPGQQKVVSDLITVPFNLREQAKFVSAEIGNTRDSGWDASSQTAIQVLLLPAVKASSSSLSRADSRTKPGLQSKNSKSLPSSFNMSQFPHIAERKLTPEEIEKELQNVHGVA
jgi:hypothetical protein